MTKYNIGTKVHIIGLHLKGKKGIIKKIGKTNKGKRIFYVAPVGSPYTTPMLNSQIKKRNLIKARKKK